MPTDPAKTPPAPSVRRLPIYLHYLRDQRTEGRESVSCTHIAADLGLIPVQVRKDLAITGIVGRPKIGYELPALIDAIERFLGWNTTREAYLVGAGFLGGALLGYDGFTEDGLKVVAAFDVSARKIGRRINGIEILDFKKLPAAAKKRPVPIGVITVPARAAQEVADVLVESGVKAIWNFTPVKIELPPEVICEDVRLASSLALLTSRLKASLDSE